MASKSVVTKPNKVGNNYYVSKVTGPNADNTFSSTLFRTDAQGKNEVPIAGYGAASDGQTSRVINTTNATAEEQKLLADPNSQLNQTRSNQIKSTEKDFFGTNGGTAEQKTGLNKASGAGNQGKSGTEESKPTEGGDAAASAAASDTSKTRLKYDPIVIYPANLKSDLQDCVKFTMLQYTPSELKSQGGDQSKSRVVTVTGGNPQIGSRSPLTTIVLPVPGGISDSNTVEWSADSINEFQQAFADIASNAIQGGPGSAESAAQDRLGSAVGKDGGQAAEQALTTKFTEAATKSQNLQQRKYGNIANPNLELLFTGPSLRTFNFNFRMSPRNKDDAEKVLKIIRYFKQGMSVKRNASSLILRSPHTFAIAYISKNEQHKFLNRFKECALTACNVNYTPDGNYMTYYRESGGNSMTAYELSLTFQELEPLFDDEYGNSDDGIGF